MIRFHDSTLFISLRSPFARRVRLAFIEHGVRYHEVVEDVFKPSAVLIEANPGRSSWSPRSFWASFTH